MLLSPMVELCALTNDVNRDYWDDNAGPSNTMTGLRSNPDYPNNPDLQDKPSTLNGVSIFDGTTTHNWSDRYAWRMWGWIVPQETGTYYFYTAGDDYNEFYLSSDFQESNASLAARVQGWTPYLSWGDADIDDTFELTGGGVSLTAGTPYYFYFEMVENTGGDSGTVGWRKPSDGAYANTPTEIVPSSVLTSRLEWYWDNTSGDSIWDTNTNWLTDVVPVENQAVYFEDDYGTGTQTIDLNGDREVQSINIDNPSAYTFNNDTLIFNDRGEDVAININDTAGTGTGNHTINSDIDVMDAMTINVNTTNQGLVTTGIISAADADTTDESITKTGAGFWRIDGSSDNTFDGMITVNAGTVYLSKDAGVDATAGDMTLNGGSVVYEADNQLASTSDITLSGGTLDLDGHTDTVGTLTLSGDSVIDFGSGEIDFTFSDIASISGDILSIYNWTGDWINAGVAGVGDGSVDRLLFTSIGSYSAGDYLSNVRFYSDDGTTLLGEQGRFVVNGAGYELVPVPEARTVVSLGLLIAAGVCLRCRQRRKAQGA